MAETALWPWLTLIGLGMFHGANPAMGWLFAVALGQHRGSRSAVLGALVPIAIGHLLSTVIIAGLIVSLGFVVDHGIIRKLSGLLLIGWGLYHQIYGHRHRVRVGMTAGFFGLLLWSFLMATAHGAGMMLVPALIPLCLSGTPAAGLLSGGSLLIAALAIGLHALSMLVVTGVIAVGVYEWLGLGFLRRGWINLDLLWTVALVLAGTILVLT
ncbi:MAG: hypothetical protein R3F54_09600 [Alphaproteobacteria bacterium]